MKIVSAFIVIIFILLPVHTFAEGDVPRDKFEWKPIPGLTSAELAIGQEWDLISSDALSWPDGRSALLTYWENKKSSFFLRCVDFRDASFQHTGGSCYNPVSTKSANK